MLIPLAEQSLLVPDLEKKITRCFEYFSIYLFIFKDSGRIVRKDFVIDWLLSCAGVSPSFSPCSSPPFETPTDINEIALWYLRITPCFFQAKLNYSDVLTGGGGKRERDREQTKDFDMFLLKNLLLSMEGLIVLLQMTKYICAEKKKASFLPLCMAASLQCDLFICSCSNNWWWMYSKTILLWQLDATIQTGNLLAAERAFFDFSTVKESFILRSPPLFFLSPP